MSDEPPRGLGPEPRDNHATSQYGGVEVLLAKMYLAGAVSTTFDALLGRLNLRAERSFNEGQECGYAYLETAEDAFLLVKWDPAPNVAIYAYIQDPESRNGDQRARPELRRFLSLASVSSEELVFPPKAVLDSE
jgi:hypothetical protein